MKRCFPLAIAVVSFLAALTLVSVPSVDAKPLGPNGQIAFFRFNASQRPSFVYTVNSDGGVLRRLTGHTAAHPHWSPDGTEIAVDEEIDTPSQPSAFLYNVETGAIRELTGTLGRNCQVWSPTGSRLACNGDGINGDESNDPGIVTIRSTDGGDLRRVTDFVGVPGDYSPDGKSLSLVGKDPAGNLRMFDVKTNGTGLTPLTPVGQQGLFDEDGGSWSPDGSQIIFQARTDSDHRRSVWTVHPDGSGLHQMAIAGCGGLFTTPGSGGCLDPSWSPDGRQITFDRIDGDTGLRNIYTVNADGTSLNQVTHGGNADEAPDWGTHSPRSN